MGVEVSGEAGGDGGSDAEGVLCSRSGTETSLDVSEGVSSSVSGDGNSDVQDFSSSTLVSLV